MSPRFSTSPLRSPRRRSHVSLVLLLGASCIALSFFVLVNPFLQRNAQGLRPLQGSPCTDQLGQGVCEVQLQRLPSKCTTDAGFRRRCQRTCNSCNTAMPQSTLEHSPIAPQPPTVVTASTNSGDCRNLLAHGACAHRPKEYCQHDQHTKENCRKTCGLCPSQRSSEPVNAGSTACQDLLQDCHVRPTDYCKYDQETRDKCQKHCNLCPTPGEQHQAPALVMNSNPGCEDLLQDCRFRPTDYCKYDQETREKCKQHCGLCGTGQGSEHGSAVGSTDKHPTDAEGCEDLLGNNACAFRPADYCKYDQDTQNNCKKHCGLCGQATNPVVVASQGAGDVVQPDYDLEHVCDVATFDDPKRFPPNFYDARVLYPELVPLLKHTEEIVAELQSAPKSVWRSLGGKTGYWEQIELFGFGRWVNAVERQLPETTRILKEAVAAGGGGNIVGFTISKIFTGVSLQPHYGWAELSNHVLRAQVPLVLPKESTCRIWVEGMTMTHASGNVLLFDDSKYHTGCCTVGQEGEERIVLIADVERIKGVIPEGTSKLATNALFSKIKDHFLQD